MKKKQVLVLLMAATLTVGTVSPVYAMETESENFEMTVETPEEVSVTSETEGTFSEGITEFEIVNSGSTMGETTETEPTTEVILEETIPEVENEMLDVRQTEESVTENTMTLNKTELTLHRNRGEYLLVRFSGDKESVTWTTSDPAVAELEFDPGVPDGMSVTGRKPGTAIVTCTSASGMEASCYVTVKELYQAESVSINQQNVVMVPGDEMTLDASVYPVEATPTTELEWYSSDPTIVNADSQTGKITALQPGTVTITVWTRNKKSGTCEVTVRDKESVDKTALKEAIDRAKKALKEEDKYTEESVKALKTAVEEAEKVVANEKSTQENVDAATKAVEEATRDLEEKPAVPEVNKEALKAAIGKAKKALKEEDKYTEESVKALKEAVEEAEKVLADEEATQESINAATKAVEEATKGLEEKPAVPEVNKDALKVAIETAKEALKEEDKYTEESVKALKAAVEEAEKVLADEKASQESIDTATKTVKEATRNLEEKPSVPEVNKEALKAAIEKAEDVLKNLDEDAYTPESVEMLKEVLETAKAVFNNPDAAQDEVDEMVRKITIAIDGMVEKPVDPGQKPDEKPEVDADPDQKPEEKPEINPDQKLETNANQKPVSPKTGDPATLGLFGAGLALSGGLITKLTRKRSKSNKKTN